MTREHVHSGLSPWRVWHAIWQGFQRPLCSSSFSIFLAQSCPLLFFLVRTHQKSYGNPYQRTPPLLPLLIWIRAKIASSSSQEHTSGHPTTRLREPRKPQGTPSSQPRLLGQATSTETQMDPATSLWLSQVPTAIRAKKQFQRRGEKAWLVLDIPRPKFGSAH